MEIEDTIPKHGPEYSEYKKKVLNQDLVILCVAEAEKLVYRIGQSLLEENNRDNGADQD